MGKSRDRVKASSLPKSNSRRRRSLSRSKSPSNSCSREYQKRTSPKRHDRDRDQVRGHHRHGQPNRGERRDRSKSNEFRSKRRDERNEPTNVPTRGRQGDRLDAKRKDRQSSSSSDNSEKIRKRKIQRRKPEVEGNHSDKLKKTERMNKKTKKTRQSSSSSDSDDSSSSGDSFKLLIKLEAERKRQLEETRKRKELVKALETPEEKRLRRLSKKDAKERKRKERMGWDNEYLHYTNDDNPFGDHSLLDTFIWKKKLEKDGMQDVSREEMERINRLKQEESKRELDKVKKRRLEREKERQTREEEESLIQREKEAAQFKEWGKQEDIFHLEQATLRSQIRIKDGRAKPIDLLAQYISAEEEVDAIEMHEPYTYLNGLMISDLEDLIEDIKVYKQLEMGKNLNYWNDITVIVEDELRKLRKLDQDDDYRVALDRREGINPSVAKDVAAIFKGKSAEQLQALKAQIQSKLDGSTSGVDISYWESLLSQLKAHIARAQLRDRHQENLRKKLALLKAEQGVELELDAADEIDDTKEEVKPESPIPGPSAPRKSIENAQEDEANPSPKSGSSSAEEDGESENEGEIVIDECIVKYCTGSYSPHLIQQDDIEPGIFVIMEEEDNSRLELARAQVLSVGQKVESVWTAEEKALQHEAKKGMTNDEAIFSVETPLDQVYLWSDKYRPRKPRYFNRVHTGFEWNKYNQTHYDMDNPPPKIVQGYKFNIFFPDLINKSTTPQYFLTTCADNPDFAILRFHSGPPYEDIAFKIVNREWEYSYKRGFRCQFHNNIFQLWFHFKRYRYRR